MSAPEQKLIAPRLSVEHALELLEQITRDDHDIAAPLFELLRGVVDPDGNPDLFAIADAVMQRAIVKTPEFQEWYRGKLIA